MDGLAGYGTSTRGDESPERVKVTLGDVSEAGHPTPSGDGTLWKNADTPHLSATRVEALQRALHLLRENVIVPYYEPVERVRVTSNRAASVEAVVDAIVQKTFREK